MSKSYSIVIPVRYASTRFPGKPLSMIGDKTMLAHVIDRCLGSGAERVIVSTDDERIADHAREHKVTIVMTPETCRSGTERIAVALAQLDFSDDDIIVNVQGDEPLIAPENIEQVAGVLMHNPDAAVASLYQPIKSQIELMNPHVVKVLVDDQDRALYFSRAEVPFAQDREAISDYLQQGHYKKHIGMYAYRSGFLKQMVNLEPSAFSSIESLEQLSWLSHGYTLQMAKANSDVAMDVNTEDDLEKICQLWDEMAVV